MSGIDDEPITIDEAIQHFVECLARKELPAPDDPVLAEDLAAVTDAISPQKLPGQLVTLWTRFQREAGGLANGLPLMPAKSALELWLRDKEERTWPWCLFPIAYACRRFVWIELDDEAGEEGGAIWIGQYEGGDVVRIAPSLAELVEAIVDGWNQGIIAEEDGYPGIRDVGLWLRLLSEHFGSSRVVDCEKRWSWPGRWKQCSELEEGVPLPGERITRICDLGTSLDWRAGRSVVVEGDVRVLMGMEDGSRCVIDDGTATIEAWIPETAYVFANSRRPGPKQVEVVRANGRARERDIDNLHGNVSRSLTGGRILAAQFAVVRFMFGFKMHEAQATAISVRWSGKAGA